MTAPIRKLPLKYEASSTFLRTVLGTTTEIAPPRLPDGVPLGLLSSGRNLCPFMYASTSQNQVLSGQNVKCAPLFSPIPLPLRFLRNHRQSFGHSRKNGGEGVVGRRKQGAHRVGDGGHQAGAADIDHVINLFRV